MSIRGEFLFHMPDGSIQVVPNLITKEGAAEYLKMIFQADTTLIAGGGNFFMGLADQVPVKTDTLVAISTEPTSAGGYARQPLTRDTLGWPTVGEVNGVQTITSAVVNFTPSGVDYSRTISRAFLCSVVSGTAGKLFSMSGALNAPTLLTVAGGNFPVQYRAYLD